MNPDQTAPKEQSDLGPYCLQYCPPKNILKQKILMWIKGYAWKPYHHSVSFAWRKEIYHNQTDPANYQVH